MLAETLVAQAAQAAQAETDETGELLAAFLSAKELEGCAERTLGYYESTLAHFVKAVDISLTQVDTEALHANLMDYQKQHCVSKVVADNIQRILSSFFARLEDEDHIVKSPALKIRHTKAPVRMKEIIGDEDMERLRDGPRPRHHRPLGLDRHARGRAREA